MCAEIAACSGGQTKRGPVYIWHADIDEGARIALDIATDFIPGVTHVKTAYDAYSRIQNGEDPVEVLAAAGGDAALGLVPGLKAAKKIKKGLDKAEDVADAAGDVARAAERAPRALPSPKSRGGSPPPVEHGTFHVDPKGNVIPTPAGGGVTGSPDGRFIQARDAAGNPTGVRIDGPHRPESHPDPRAQEPHGHVPGVTNSDGTPWLPIK